MVDGAGEHLLLPIVRDAGEDVEAPSLFPEAAVAVLRLVSGRCCHNRAELELLDL